MTKLLERFRSWTMRQQLTAAGGAAIALLLIGLMLRMALSENMDLLYAGLDPAAAGEVIAALDAEGVSYDVRGGSIFVPASQRDRLRLNLARQSLPAPASEGYELLDGLDGFSTTSEMFSVTYWRAKEGELSRTLMTIPGVKAARVHIGANQRGAFGRREERRTASVTVTAPAGLSDSQVRAIRYMTALAVPNLPASDVAVIDTARGLLTTDDASQEDGRDRRTRELEQSLLSLVEARVGQGNARVNVAMDIVRRREEIEERAVDPDSAVVTSRMREEARSSDDTNPGPVTVASDLPETEETDNDQTSESQELREEVAFAVSTTDRRIELLPGGVERLSVAVLLNELRDPDGETIPRAPAEIEALRELVAAAAGISEARGDIVTIRSLPFEPLPVLDANDGGGILAGLPLGRLAELAVAGVGLLLFGLFVLKPIMTQGPAAAKGSVIAGELTFDDPARAAQNPLLLLRSRSAERPDAAATLLNAWLEEDEGETA